MLRRLARECLVRPVAASALASITAYSLGWADHHRDLLADEQVLVFHLGVGQGRGRDRLVGDVHVVGPIAAPGSHPRCSPSPLVRRVGVGFVQRAAAVGPQHRHEAERRVSRIGPGHQPVARLAGLVLDLLGELPNLLPGRGGVSGRDRPLRRFALFQMNAIVSLLVGMPQTLPSQVTDFNAPGQNVLLGVVEARQVISCSCPRRRTRNPRGSGAGNRGAADPVAAVRILSSRSL